MIKYETTMITFTEVPDEISLCINCTCCPLKCRGCFEPWLREDRGEILTITHLHEILQKNKNITCVCFMGGINDYDSLAELMLEVKNLNLKVAIYSGHDFMDKRIINIVDYYKIGSYIPEYGPLNSLTTNQKFFKKENNNWTDITYRFQIKKE